MQQTSANRTISLANHKLQKHNKTDNEIYVLTPKRANLWRD